VSWLDTESAFVVVKARPPLTRWQQIISEMQPQLAAYRRLAQAVDEHDRAFGLGITATHCEALVEDALREVRRLTP
jgi:hypothetical protein